MPKFEPVIVTLVPCVPQVGKIPVKTGAGPKVMLSVAVALAATVTPVFSAVT